MMQTAFTTEQSSSSKSPHDSSPVDAVVVVVACVVGAEIQEMNWVVYTLMSRFYEAINLGFWFYLSIKSR